MCPWAAGTSVASYSENTEGVAAVYTERFGRSRMAPKIRCGETILSLPHRDSRMHLLDATAAVQSERSAYLSFVAWSATAVVSEVIPGVLFHSARSSRVSGNGRTRPSAPDLKEV